MRVLAPIFALALAAPALGQAADPAWPDIAAATWPGGLGDGAGLISIDAPYRSADDARTVIAARVAAPEGALIDRVTLVLDENPMPISAVFDLARPQRAFAFEATMRINGPTPVHVIAETGAGAFVAETFVKTSGLGACSAPPGTDPKAALATLGRMELRLTDPGDPAERLRALAEGRRDLSVDLSHPSHSGMQMDQVSLLFIPFRYVERLDLTVDGAPYAAMTGSISLSENPSVTVSVPAATRAAAATMTDTDGTVTTARTRAAGY